MHLHSHLKRVIALGLKLAFTAFALWLALRDVDLRTLPGLLHTQRRGFLFGALALLVAQVLFGAERWRVVLRALSPGEPVPGAVPVHVVYYSSIFFNCCLPGAIGGDVARLWLSRVFHLSFGHILSSIILDRLLTLAALFVLAACALPAIHHPLAHRAWEASLAILVLGAVAACLPGVLERALKRMEQKPLVARLRWLMGQCRQLNRQWPLAGLAMFYALLAHICFALAAYSIAQSLGIAVGIPVMLALMPLVMLAIVLPVSIGGWGVREASMVGLLGLVGVGHQAALMVSVQLGLAGIAASLPGGALWLIAKGKAQAARA